MKKSKASYLTLLGAFAVITLICQSFSSSPVLAQDDLATRQEISANRLEVTRTLGEPPPPPKNTGTKQTQHEDDRTPNLQSPTASPDPIKESADLKFPDRGTNWTVVKNETFEEIWPGTGWNVFDNSGSTNGEYFWDDDDFKPHNGSWSAWEANGGVNGLDPATNNYPNYLDSWMIYGPFDLSTCSDADVWFYYWNKSEIDYDWLYTMASADGANFGGWMESGDSGGWKFEDFDLQSYLGDDSVWLAFVATSDYSNTDVGAFVDDITIYCGRENATKSWTMMVYLDGDNNLESAAVGDFLEMASAGSDSNVAILAQMDRIGGYDSSYGDWADTKRFYITPGLTPEAANGIGIGEVNMGDPETLLKFIRWAKAKAPATHYFLVMWDHGSGWRSVDPYAPPTKGVSFDDTSGGDAIDSKELRDVLATATSGGTYPIDIVGLDACMMAMDEIDTQIKPYGLIRVSSEETEPNDGWPYDTILSALKTNYTWSGSQLATKIVDDYYSSYGNDQTQSAVNLGSLYTTLNTAVDSFAQAMINNGNNWIAELYSSRNNTTQFSYTYYVDLWDFADWVRINVSDPTINAAAITVKNAITAAVIHEHHGTAWPWARGISIYFPKTSGEYDARYDGSSGFLVLTANTHWDEWIHKYHVFASYPAMFAKSSPANGTTNQPVSPALTWGASSGATSYEVCTDTTDDNACSTWVNVGNVTTINASGLSQNTTYYWQVRANNSSGTVYADHGAWRSLTTGTLPGTFNKTSPTSGTSNVSLNTTLSWGTSTGATNYQYCYDTTNDNACSTWITTTSTSAAISGLSQYTTYYWHVLANNSIGYRYSNTSSTAFWYFTTGGIPGAFGKSSPTNGAAEVSLNPTLSWGTSTNTTNYEYCYDTTNDNACSSWVSVGTATSVALSGLSPSTTYYWQVAANNTFGFRYADGAPTVFWSFTTGSPPLAFSKVSPANGATSQPINLTLSWGASGEALEKFLAYEYCIDLIDNSDCDDSWISTGAATSVTPSGLMNNTLYYWQARAQNGSGYTYADAGTWWSFKTIPIMITKTFTSQGANDGWVLESTETSNIGGSMNNSSNVFYLGDSNSKQQYRGVLSFATGAVLPDNAVITSVTLKFTKSTIVGGGNPVTLFQGFMVDIKKGFLGSAAALQVADFQASAPKTLGPFLTTPVGSLYTFNLNAGKAYINKLATGSGLTQIRLRFKLDDNNNAIANYLSLFTGNNSTGKPTLVVKYYVP